MPPSSRKRNKGKDRKAKKERSDANKFWRCGLGVTGCNHGCASISDDHPVSSFMDQFIINAHHDLSVCQTLKDIFESHPQIWNNESYRRLAIGILIRIGTNMMLRFVKDDVGWPVFIAQSLMVLEHYNGTGDIDSVINSRVVCSKNRDLDNGDSSRRRDILKFYRKRVSCKCLKKMHLEERKSTPKMGICCHCKVGKERVHLSVCGRCMAYHYCSRECQVAHWPKHKMKCDLWSKKGGSQIG